MAASDVINTIFEKLDADGDGSISQSELEGIFKIFDEDGNGSVSKAEFEGAYTAKLGGTADQAGKVFSKLDVDGSGDISVNEITELFKKMDTDNNGVISKDEFVQTWSAMMA